MKKSTPSKSKPNSSVKMKDLSPTKNPKGGMTAKDARPPKGYIGETEKN